MNTEKQTTLFIAGKFSIAADPIWEMQVFRREGAPEAMLAINNEVFCWECKAEDVSFKPSTYNECETCIHFFGYAFPIDDAEIDYIKGLLSPDFTFTPKAA